MSINISKLKKSKIRRIFTFDGEKVEIYNITSDNKDIMQQLFLENYNTQTQMLDIKEDNMVELMYRTLTNIQFDTIEDLQDALNEPTHMLYLIQKELTDILTEFAIETFKEQENKIDGMLLMVEQAELLNKTDELIKLTQLDKEKLQKDANEEMKKLVQDHKKSTKKNKSTVDKTKKEAEQNADI